MPEIEIIVERCKGCKLCIEFCPVNVLKNSKNSNEKGFSVPEIEDLKKCIGCKNCEFMCPDLAIFVKEDSEKGDSS